MNVINSYVRSKDSHIILDRINVGFILSNGDVYGNDKYEQGKHSHDKILYASGMSPTPGMIRFCDSFIMMEPYYTKIDDKYVFPDMTDEQYKTLTIWLISHKMIRINCPYYDSKSYLVSYLLSLDKKELQNIITF